MFTFSAKREDHAIKMKCDKLLYIFAVRKRVTQQFTDNVRLGLSLE
jgi:hypothetical protein